MIYVSSDLHGYPLEKFKALLKKAGFCDDDFLYVIGDVIDRGKEGVKILEWLISKRNALLILGNHEDMLLACDFLFDEAVEEGFTTVLPNRLRALEVWKHNGAEPTINGMDILPAKRRERILEYLRAAPIYATVTAGGRKYVLVHGGLGGYEEGKPLSDYFPHDLIWTRPTLDMEYSTEFTTVIGHTPTHFYGSRHRGKMLRTKTWINIDTGAAAGGSPMLLRLDDLAVFYARD